VGVLLSGLGCSGSSPLRPTLFTDLKSKQEWILKQLKADGGCGIRG